MLYCSSCSANSDIDRVVSHISLQWGLNSTGTNSGQNTTAAWRRRRAFSGRNKWYTDTMNSNKESRYIFLYCSHHTYISSCIGFFCAVQCIYTALLFPKTAHEDKFYDALNSFQHVSETITGLMIPNVFYFFSLSWTLFLLDLQVVMTDMHWCLGGIVEVWERMYFHFH